MAEKKKTGVHLEIKFDLKTLIVLLIVVVSFSAMYINNSIEKERYRLTAEQVKAYAQDRFNFQQLLDLLEVKQDGRLDVIEKRLKIAH